MKNTLENGQPDKTKDENDLITKWINSINIPLPPAVELENSQETIDAIKQKFDKALDFAVKKNNLPF